MQNETFIYGLFDPRTPDVVMYVGKGKAKRANCHWKQFLSKGTAVNALLRRWFERLKDNGVEPSWKFLEENVVDWAKQEKFWISNYRLQNSELCNISEGGNGLWSLEGAQLGGKTVWKIHSEALRDVARRNGLRRIELHGNPATPDGCVKGGRTTGKRWSGTPEQKAWMRKGGKNGSSENKARATRRMHELHPGLIERTLHRRWHVARSIQNPNCRLCCEDWIARRGDISRLFEIAGSSSCS